MRTQRELLQAAAERRLIGIVDVIDRPHVVWQEPDGSTSEVDARDARQVVELMSGGLVQFGDRLEAVHWYGGGLAHGKRLLPTTQGRLVLERLRDQAELVAGQLAPGRGVA
jgi:hypothetical protein